MGSTMFAVFLPLALALVMFGLGVTLTVADFARVARYPKAAAVALACQILVLPVICYGLIQLFGLTGALAAGMMLLVAAPGGPSANLFSHIAGGDVALNITLTAINSVIAVFTMPVIAAFAFDRFLDDGAKLGVRPDKFIQVFAIVLVPVAIGMFVRHRFADRAERMRGGVKIASIAVLALVVVGAFAQQPKTFTENFGTLIAVCLVLSTLSFALGFVVPRLFGVAADQAIASAMEIGIHNGALAITVAVSVLHNEKMAVAPALYGLSMNIPAVIAAFLLARFLRKPAPVAVEA
ncbi:bile acid:sodium symporter family protein [Nocardia panacis]|uniref:Bile acid:sodium symporter family protein n=1 Tax=Nocardia panacis TaxID=2340916 RepID=A0A3A4KIT9_9NOCA|nr:bile acid:sodium symporter family protein [Nocardia panacis]RJO73603.1 bile acid:sodium symporter family protein [Nocardia panacis]